LDRYKTGKSGAAGCSIKEGTEMRTVNVMLKPVSVGVSFKVFFAYAAPRLELICKELATGKI
jgi:hypothetical protein